ncbi:MAG: proton-conducting transporter membrane subunit [Thermaerobacter sp.]|nr:proton-conducting transporter membrane subunit [Thermaerobacter sp.]
MMVAAIPVIPLLAALAVLLFRHPTPARLITAAGGLATLLLSIDLAQQVTHRVDLVVLPGWVGVNGLSALILVLQGFVAMTATIYSWGYMKHQARAGEARERRYYLNLNLFLSSLFLVPIFLQPALTWVAVELTTVLSVFLVSFDSTPQALEAAWKYAIITIMGATVAVLGIFLLLWGLSLAHVAVQTWASLKATAPLMPPLLLKLAFVLILIGFGTKVGIVPMHTWLPDAHSQAPSSVCALLSGIEVSTILYVIMRLWPVFAWIPGSFAQHWALAFGLLSVGVAAFLMIQVHDFKRLFAFSTVEQMGIVLVALGLGPAGGYASLYQVLTHAVTKSLAFYSAGAVLLTTGTRDIASVKGLIRVSPVSAMSLLFSGLAIAGAPPFAIFLSELSIFRSTWQTGHILVLVLLLGFLTVAFLGVLLKVNRMVFGQSHHRPVSLPLTIRFALLVGWLPVLVFGVYLPRPMHHLLTLAALTLRR